MNNWGQLFHIGRSGSYRTRTILPAARNPGHRPAEDQLSLCEATHNQSRTESPLTNSPGPSHMNNWRQLFHIGRSGSHRTRTILPAARNPDHSPCCRFTLAAQSSAQSISNGIDVHDFAQLHAHEQLGTIVLHWWVRFLPAENE